MNVLLEQHFKVWRGETNTSDSGEETPPHPIVRFPLEFWREQSNIPFSSSDNFPSLLSGRTTTKLHSHAFTLKAEICSAVSCQVIYSQFGLAIHQNDHQAMRRFVEWAQNEIAVVPDFHKRILLSDEAHFWLNGYVNKQNCRIWSEANPQVYVETPLHPEKLTV
ncbi:uncharacterized protein TNCV_1654591 [Trichonephila clavipes]|nr:uncharacterized protein TNCV_1654591 [Trichonephila clavipes]